MHPDLEIGIYAPANHAWHLRALRHHELTRRHQTRICPANAIHLFHLPPGITYYKTTPRHKIYPTDTSCKVRCDNVLHTISLRRGRLRFHNHPLSSLKLILALKSPCRCAAILWTIRHRVACSTVSNSILPEVIAKALYGAYTKNTKVAHSHHFSLRSLPETEYISYGSQYRCHQVECPHSVT